MKEILVGALVGFLVGGVLGGTTFGPLGSLVGSIAGIPLGAMILRSLSVDPLFMVNSRASGWRLASRCPWTFVRRDILLSRAFTPHL